MDGVNRLRSGVSDPLPSAGEKCWMAGTCVFERGSASGLWRVVSGVVRLDQRGTDTTVLVSLAMPGDLIGYETLLGSAHSFDASVLVPATLQAIAPTTQAERHALMVEALLQQPQRSHDMARIRTGPVLARVGTLLRLLGHVPPPDFLIRDDGIDADAVRRQLPALRELAEVVDAKPETVCRALAQLLPPRSRKSGPRRWTEKAQQAASQVLSDMGHVLGTPGLHRSGVGVTP